MSSSPKNTSGNMLKPTLKVNVVNSNGGSGATSPKSPPSPGIIPASSNRASVSGTANQSNANVTTTNNSTQQNTKSAYDVIVIGAGVSGLTAAHELSATMGLDVLVLEASERIGGRLLTFNINRHSQDMGGAWIHPAQEHAMNLVKKLGLKLSPQYATGKTLVSLTGVKSNYSIDENQAFFDILNENERKYMDKVVLESWQESLHQGPKHWSGMDGQTVSSYLDAQENSDIDPSLLNFDDNGGNGGDGNDADAKDTGKISKARALFEAEFRSMFSCEPKQVSMLHLLEETLASNGFLRYFTASSSKHGDIVGGEGEFRIIGGAQQICTKLLASTPNATIVKNAPVLNVKSLATAAITGITGGSYNYSVYSTQQRKWNCRYLVIAIPPNQINRISFETGLIPANKLHIYANSFMGQCIKMVFLYRSAFWRSQGLSGKVLCVSRDPNMTSKLHPSFGITMIYDTSDEEIENTGTASPSRSSTGKFYALTVFSCGRQAANLRTLNSGDARKSWVVQALQSLFGDGAKDVLAHSEVDWSSHGYIGGAYAAIPALGAISSNRHDNSQTLYELMASSVGHIHFAGTETAAKYRGYISGAIESGKRVALEIETSIKHSYQPFSDLPHHTKTPIFYYGLGGAGAIKASDLKAGYLSLGTGIFAKKGRETRRGSSASSVQRLGLISMLGLSAAGLLTAAFVLLRSK